MSFRLGLLVCSLAASLVLGGCKGRTSHPQSSSGLQLEKVVLYRNGVGYFDHVGYVKDGTLRLSVPREHLNDILKSLTVVDPHGQVLRVSMPLDEGAFDHQDAFSQHRLHETLRALRGSPVELTLRDSHPDTLRGRIFQVESFAQTPVHPVESQVDWDDSEVAPGIGEPNDYRISLLGKEGIVSAPLSQVTKIHLLDRGIQLSLDRALDSSAGQGSMQLVDVDIVLSNSGAREVSVSYVVEAPVWKPTYRVVIPGDGMNQVLLQGWAVVHNMSGEDWNDVQLSLAAGAPIAFRYDMHRPSRVKREDLSWMHRQKQAEVAVGEARHEQEEIQEAEGEEEMAKEDEADVAMEDAPQGRPMPLDESPNKAMKRKKMRPPTQAPESPGGGGVNEVAKSVPMTRPSSQASGLTQITLGSRLSIPQGRSSMLAFVNERVPGEAALLFRVGGAGPGYTSHPYRVLRFRNQTPLRLESGPISLYAGGTFIGEGIADPIGSGAWATIPYAVETDIEVANDVVEEDSPSRVLRVIGGVLEVEQFSQTKLTWRVQGRPHPKPRSMYIDQTKSGPRYELVSPKPDSDQVEVFPDFYRLHMVIPANKRRASLDVVQKTPSSYSLSIWDSRALSMLEYSIEAQGLSPEVKKRLTPIIELRRALASIDTKLASLQRQRSDLEFQADQLRRNLKVIAKDRDAKELRKKLTEQLVERSEKISELGRQIVTLRNQRLNTRLKLEEIVQRIDLRLVSRPSAKTKSPVKPVKPEPEPVAPTKKAPDSPPQ